MVQLLWSLLRGRRLTCDIGYPRKRGVRLCARHSIWRSMGDNRCDVLLLLLLLVQLELISNRDLGLVCVCVYL